MRLAFSIATTVEADILLMDEWLSVGDADFVKLAEEQLRSQVNRTPILVMATHSPDILKEVCTRVMRIEKGRTLFQRHAENFRGNVLMFLPNIGRNKDEIRILEEIVQLFSELAYGKVQNSLFLATDPANEEKKDENSY